MIRLEGVSGISFDGSFGNSGRYFKFINTATSASKTATFKISDGGTGMNCNSIAIKNSEIVGASATVANSYAIYLGSKDMNESANAPSIDSIDITGNMISKAYKAIWAAGGAGNANNIKNLVIKNNIIGSNTISESIASNGIRLNNAYKAIIYGNEIFNLNAPSAINAIGLEIYGGCDTSVIEKNIIHGLYSTSSSYASWA